MHISNMHTVSRAFIPTGKKAKDDCRFELVHESRPDLVNGPTTDPCNMYATCM